MEIEKPAWERIEAKTVLDMLYLIRAYADRKEAKRFNGLSFEQRQQVTYILKRRARRARNHTQPLDLYIVREVIDDAKRNIFIFD